MAKKGPGRTKIRTHTPIKAAAKGLKEGEERYIFIASSEDVETIKDIAYWERLTIKDTFAKAIANYKAIHERKNGPLKPRPK